jgi:hypothetical protein
VSPPLRSEKRPTAMANVVVEVSPALTIGSKYSFVAMST